MDGHGHYLFEFQRTTGTFPDPEWCFADQYHHRRSGICDAGWTTLGNRHTFRNDGYRFWNVLEFCQ